MTLSAVSWRSPHTVLFALLPFFLISAAPAEAMRPRSELNSRLASRNAPLTRFVVREGITNDRKEYEEEIDALVKEMSSYVAKNFKDSLAAGHGSVNANGDVVKFVFEPRPPPPPPHPEGGSRDQSVVVGSAINNIGVYMPKKSTTAGMPPSSPPRAIETMRTTERSSIQESSFTSKSGSAASLNALNVGEGNGGAEGLKAAGKSESHVYSNHQTALSKHRQSASGTPQQSNGFYSLVTAGSLVPNLLDIPFQFHLGPKVAYEDPLEASPSEKVSSLPGSQSIYDQAFPQLGRYGLSPRTTLRPLKGGNNEGTKNYLKPTFTPFPPQRPAEWVNGDWELQQQQQSVPQPVKVSSNAIYPSNSASMNRKYKPTLAPFGHRSSTILPFATFAGSSLYKPTVGMKGAASSNPVSVPLSNSGMYKPTFGTTTKRPIFLDDPNFGLATTKAPPSFDLPGSYKPTLTPSQALVAGNGAHIEHTLLKPLIMSDSGNLYKPTIKPLSPITTSDFFVPPEDQLKPTKKTTTRRPVQTLAAQTTTRRATTRRTTTRRTTTAMTTTAPPTLGVTNQVVEVSLFELVESFAFAFDDYLKNIFGDGLGKTALALRETLSGRNSAVNLLIVFGIPVATSALTFLGAGPLSIGIAAWLIPVAAVLLIPNFFGGDSLSRTRLLL